MIANIFYTKSWLDDLRAKNNKIDPYRVCFPTSEATVIEFCLNKVGKTELDIGCPPDMQLDDYITTLAQSAKVKQYLKQNVSKFGQWVLEVEPRYIGIAEAFIFNDLMNQFGFYAQFKTGITFEQYCDIIEETQLPQIGFGNFKGMLAGNGGHIVAVVGFNRDKKTFTVMDPYGDANTKYTNNIDGKYKEYAFEKWFDKGKSTLWMQHNRYEGDETLWESNTQLTVPNINDKLSLKEAASASVKRLFSLL